MMAITYAEAGEHETAKEIVSSERKEKIMKPTHNKGALALKTLVFGAASLSLYYIVFTHVDWITTEFTKGGWHAAYPVCTALIFSFVHGAFASNFLSLIGLEAKGH